MESMLDDGTLTRLLAEVKEQDHNAFTQVYEKAYKKVLLACQRILPGQALAEDALQETFLKVWRHAGQFDPSRSCGATWIEAIARHTALDLLRRQRLVPFSESDSPGDTLPDSLREGPASELEALQRCNAVQRGMARLGNQERDSLRLAFFHDLSHAQLADQMDRPLGTVKSWIRRGMQQLRQELGSVRPQL